MGKNSFLPSLCKSVQVFSEEWQNLLTKTLIFYSSLCKHGTHLILHYYHGNYFLNYFLTSVTTILNFNLPAPLRQGQIVRLF